jgi:hypothetical protein
MTEKPASIQQIIQGSCLIIALGCILIFLSSCTSRKPESKEEGWLRECEDQIKKALLYPDSYEPIWDRMTSSSQWRTIPQLSDKDKETVVWDFFYDGEKPSTVVGQASKRPLLKGVGQCEINKLEGSVKAEKVF